MFIKQAVSLGNLLLDTDNYRIIKQASQKGARDAIISEQGRKLVKLAEDIVEHGLNPFDLPMVIDAEDGNQNYVVVEGNRRLTAIQLMLEPDLAHGTVLYTPFSRLKKQHADAIPKVIDCVIAPNKQSALVWINRKHANGLEGAGTEHWTAMAKARADLEQKIPRPDMDVINFVLTNPDLDDKLRAHLEGSKFNLTTLERLVTTKELKDSIGLEVTSGKVKSKYEKSWTLGVLTDLVATIAEGKFKNGERAGRKFTEREVDNQEKREEFVGDLLADHPGRRKAADMWTVNGNPKASVAAKKTAGKSSTKETPSTGNQPNVIPKGMKLQLPAGKVNDIFVELRKLDVVTNRHAVSVLLRVFLELSIDSYLRAHKATPKQGEDTLIKKLKATIALLEKNGEMTAKELASIKTEVSDRNSLISPVTLNAYVHSEWMHPDPLRLKVTWNNAQLLVERVWGSVNGSGHA